MLKAKSSQTSGRKHIRQTSLQSLNKRYQLATKLMATVFWDSRGAFTLELIQQRTTTTLEAYFERLKHYVGRAGRVTTKGVEC
jgi:hypothetical protein